VLARALSHVLSYRPLVPAHALSRAFPHQRLELAPGIGLHPWLCGGGPLGHTGEFEADDAQWGQVRRSQSAEMDPLARAPKRPRVLPVSAEAFLATQAGPTPHSSGFIQEFSVQVGRVQDEVRWRVVRRRRFCRVGYHAQRFRATGRTKNKGEKEEI